MTPAPRHGDRARLAGGSLTLCGLLLVPVAVAYAWRPDALAGISIWPPVCWVALGLPTSLLGALLRRQRKAWLLPAAWLFFAVATADELPAALRRRAPAVGADLRVVTLNCGGGQDAAAAEALALQPDLVLLQESPSRPALEHLVAVTWGRPSAVAWGPDGSVLARGQVVGQPRQASHFTAVRIRLTSGREVAVVSLRLMPVPLDFDLWSARFQRDMRAHRAAQRRELAEIAALLEQVPASVPVVLGGDFNAPPGDPVFRPLAPRLCDGWRRAGVGWGDTILNDLPVSRIDRVFVSEHLRPLRLAAGRTAASDHRLVVAEYAWR